MTKWNPTEQNKIDNFSTDSPLFNCFIALSVFLQILGQGIKPENCNATEIKYVGYHLLNYDNKYNFSEKIALLGKIHYVLSW